MYYYEYLNEINRLKPRIFLGPEVYVYRRQLSVRCLGLHKLKATSLILHSHCFTVAVRMANTWRTPGTLANNERDWEPHGYGSDHTHKSHNLQA